MNRFETIKSLVYNAKVIADIGCDHGQVGFDLLSSGSVNYVIATDISDKCLQKSNVLFSINDMEDHYSSRVGDGLVPLDDGEADVIIIAGMGGDLIEQILKSDISKTQSFKTYILQPMTSPEVVRKFMSQHGYRITKDLIVQEKDKFYFVMRFDLGKEAQKEEDYFFTRTLKRDNSLVLDEYLKREISTRKSILTKLNNSTEKTLTRIRVLKREIAELERYYES